MDHHQCTNLHTSIDGALSCKVSSSTPVDRRRNELSSCRRNQNTRRRSCRRQGLQSSSRHFLLALYSIFISVACLWGRGQAFSSSSSSISIQQSRISNVWLSNSVTQQRQRDNTKFYMSAVIEPTSQSSPSRMSDFQRRMKGIVKRNGVANGRKVVGSSRSTPEKPQNLKTVHTLEEYKDQLDESSGKIVIVRFFATWCKACKAIQPSFYRMAALYPNITFLEVPVTNQNANLHQGLEVPSLPYGHIYYPEAGLVEEMKISKKYFPGLVKKVRWYNEGLCGLDEFVPEDSDDDSDNEDDK